MESIRRKIDEAEDIADVIELMQNLNIQTRGCKTIEQMKEKIFDHLRSRKDNHLASNEAFKVISDAQSMDKRKSLSLFNFYSDIEREIKGLDDSLLNLLRTSEGDVLSKMKSRMERMENREYVVLVAGETSAGKSSMLNLILGEELLPFSVLSTTSTICELKYGRDRRIKIHYKEQGKSPRTKYLEESSSYMDQISEFVHVKSPSSREKASHYKKVELFWPHNLLKDGVVIVDSPGVGESDIMDDIVINYLPNAFAFIYVINSANAGGVQKDRLVRLLHKTRQLTTEQQMDFSPNCTLFVCNKWDNIPPAEANDVIAHITNKLRLCLPDLDPETQIIRLSTTKALMAQKFGIMNAEFASLTENISCLVTKSIKTRLEQNWSWLDQLLYRIIWIMKSFIENINTDHVAATQRLNKVIERLQKLQAEQESSKQKLKRHLDRKIFQAIEVLASYLKSPEVIESFCRWNTDEIPDIEGSWEVTWSAINKLVQNRLQTVIEEWEEEHEHFAEARKSVVTVFLKTYNYLEKELHNLEVNVLQTQNKSEKQVETVEKQVFNNIDNSSGMEIEEKILIGIAAPFLVPVALVGAALAVPVTLLILPAVGIMSIVDCVQEGREKSAYNKDRPAYVRNISQRYLGRVATVGALQPLVKDQLTQALTCLDELQAKVPMLIEADVQLCQHLIDESQSKKETESLYKPRKEKCERLRGELSLFGALEICSMHIAWDDLEWDVSDDAYRKHSLPPGIYRGRISKGRYASSRQVTLKVYRELLNSSNVTKYLAHETTMRRLRHPHIVEFYGAAFRKVPRGVEVTFVMELSGKTLKYYLIDQPRNCPSVNPRSTLGVIQWTEQIIDALMVIHSMFEGCVHGDLRLENVLLDSCNLGNVKLSNICLTRQLTIEHGSKCDEFLHLPPEAIRNRAYNTSSEIYCLGIILWEMWYGKEAFLEMKGQDLEVFLVNVEEGHRPELTGLATQTSVWWCDLIKGCWEKNATERITLTDCKSTITAILANQK
ncbi:uncharacterized protein LOC144663380 isoform X1 [Oculina patagonica]